MKIDTTLKRFFYDRDAVQAKLTKKRLGALRKAALTARRVTRRKLRRRKRTSNPKESPSVHTESNFATLKNIQAGFDYVREASLVGPIGLSGTVNRPAPGLLEQGGHFTRRNYRRTERVVGGAGEISIDSPGAKPRAANTKVTTTWDGRVVLVTYGRLNTPQQARRANELNADLYGPHEISGTVEERPFMAPGMAEASESFLDLYLREG